MKTHGKIYKDIFNVKWIAVGRMKKLFSNHGVDRATYDPLNVVATLCVASEAVGLLADYENECGGEDCTTLRDISDKLLRMAEIEVMKNRIIENG